jgi:uncharacterized protein (TIGR02757 family)
MLRPDDLKEFLDEKADLYNRPSFIEADPISIPHMFSKKEDIEISGFLAASIAWGNRKMIVRNGSRMMQLMGDSPYSFVINADNDDLEVLDGFVHRTFNSSDFKYFVKALRHIYAEYGGLENIFTANQTETSLQPAIHSFYEAFFELPHNRNTERHIGDPMKGSAAKKTNMFLRWMVRNDNKGVDFGLWKSIPPSILSCPLDLHSGNVARKLGILSRKQNDAKAVIELDRALRSLDRSDPVRYDFALFGLGINENF